MRRLLVGALGWLAISAASAACAGDETQGFKLSDHECWGVPPVTVRIGPETFGPDWKPLHGLGCRARRRHAATRSR